MGKPKKPKRTAQERRRIREIKRLKAKGSLLSGVSGDRFYDRALSTRARQKKKQRRQAARASRRGNR